MSSSNTHNTQHNHGQFITLLHNLGSKEVECHVQLTIHSVSDLPVKSGRFRVRWKFRDIDAKLAKQQQKAAAALKAREHPVTQAMMSQPVSQAESRTTPTTASSSDAEDKDKPVNESKGTSSEQPQPPPANDSGNSVVYSSEERGQTDYARMRKRDHNVTYERTIDVIARMRVYKGELNSEPLKLVVEQLPNEVDAESYRGPLLRIGHRYINLAEFVNEGKLRRKYLLDHSKTNAMISVSLDITVVKAQAEFTKPVLRQDHILIGRKESPSHPRSVTGSVTSSIQSRCATVVLSRPSLDRSSASTSTVSSTSSSSRDSTPHSYHPTTPTSRSPTSTRVDTVNNTEAIIEALFNPPVFSSSTYVSLSPSSNQMKSSQSTHSVTTTAGFSPLATPHEYSDSRSSAQALADTVEVGEFGALRREEADGNGAEVRMEMGMETNVTRRPSVATTAASVATSGGWTEEQNRNQNQSQRGRLLGKLKKPFTISATSRAATPTPGGSGSQGNSGKTLNASSASISGRTRSSLDIVYPVLALEEMKTPTLAANNAQQAQRQMCHPSPQTTPGTSLAVPAL